MQFERQKLRTTKFSSKDENFDALSRNAFSRNAFLKIKTSIYLTQFERQELSKDKTSI